MMAFHCILQHLEAKMSGFLRIRARKDRDSESNITCTSEVRFDASISNRQVCQRRLRKIYSKTVPRSF